MRYACAHREEASKRNETQSDSAWKISGGRRDSRPAKRGQIGSRVEWAGALVIAYPRVAIRSARARDREASPGRKHFQRRRHDLKTGGGCEIRNAGYQPSTITQ